MTQMDIFDYAASLEARAAGCQQVLDHNLTWSERALDALRSFAARGYVFTTEDFRQSGLIDPPAHSNVWGAFFTNAARKGIIRQVGYGRPSNVRSHASVVMTWEAV